MASTWPSGGTVPTTNCDESTDDPSLCRPNIKTAFDSINSIIDSRGVNDGIPTLGTTGGIPRSELGLVLSTTGGPLSGQITLSSDPGAALEAATKQYVDAIGVNDYSIATTHIQDLAIASSNIGNAAVTTGKMAAGAILEADIGTSEVTATKLGPGSVTNSKIGIGSVGEDNLSSNIVTTAKLKFGTSSQTTIDTDPFYFSHHQYVVDVQTQKFNASSPAIDVSWGNDGGTASLKRTFVIIGASVAQKANVYWAYLTASENPNVWVSYDQLSGEIFQVWEAEDPVDKNYPDDPPFSPSEGQGILQLTHWLDQPALWKVSDNWCKSCDVMPAFANGDATTPDGLKMHLVEEAFTERGKWGKKEDLTSVYAIESLIGLTEQQRRWRYQIYLREMARVLVGSGNPSFGELLRQRFKIGRDQQLIVR